MSSSLAHSSPDDGRWLQKERYSAPHDRRVHPVRESSHRVVVAGRLIGGVRCLEEEVRRVVRTEAAGQHAGHEHFIVGRTRCVRGACGEPERLLVESRVLAAAVIPSFEPHVQWRLVAGATDRREEGLVLRRQQRIAKIHQGLHGSPCGVAVVASLRDAHVHHRVHQRVGSVGGFLLDGAVHLLRFVAHEAGATTTMAFDGLETVAADGPGLNDLGGDAGVGQSLAERVADRAAASGRRARVEEVAFRGPAPRSQREGTQVERFEELALALFGEAGSWNRQGRGCDRRRCRDLARSRRRQQGGIARLGSSFFTAGAAYPSLPALLRLLDLLGFLLFLDGLHRLLLLGLLGVLCFHDGLLAWV